jgi:ABC-type amino acid transport substrate-binding protein
MGAFASRLNTDEIWQVIAYIRSQYRDTLVKAKEKGGLTVCVASDNLPFSDKNPKPTGFEVELAEEIVRRLELRSQYFWVDTRKGLDRALGNSLLQKRCDFFMGIPSGKATGKKFEDIIFTKPYFGTGYILTIRQQSSNTHKLEDLKRMKMAVPRGSVADEYLVHRGYEPALYNNTKEALEAIQKEEVEVALLWAPEAGWWIKKHPDSSIKLVEGYIPEPELRWNFTIALREVDHNLKEAIDQVLDTLIKEEQVKKILVKYGVPFYPPFE